MTAPLITNGRDATRRRVFLAGAIAESGSAAPRMLCFVHDLNSLGAQLELAGHGIFCGDVKVYLPKLEQAVPAKVVWQDGQRIGLRFCEPLHQRTSQVQA